MQKKKAPIQWSPLEENRFSLFLALNLASFPRPRDNNMRVFKEMGAFLGTRTTNQCKSHHQKKKLGTKRLVFRHLWKFLEEEYKGRCLHDDYAVT